MQRMQPVAVLVASAAGSGANRGKDHMVCSSPSTALFIAATCIGMLSIAGCAGRPAGRKQAKPAEKRPAELVAPAPEVNPKAVVWRTPTPPVDPQAGDVWVNPKDDAPMVFVPAGEFTMGVSWTEASGSPFESPPRGIYLDAYWIDKYLVTVAQYRTFCKATGRAMPEAPSWGWKDDHPIVDVNWYDAAAYAEWAGGGLPTTAQWEKAARGTDSRKYPWGNDRDPSRSASSDRAKLTSTQPVGSHPSGASPYGCLDMAANANQWCANWVTDDSYRSMAYRNPQGPRSGDDREMKGSCWAGSQAEVYAASGNYPDRHNPYTGFRCILTVP
jgi:sulfatase modifying factor 1